jgi:hypothetical protein
MGLQRVKSEALRGGEAKENAQALVDVMMISSGLPKKLDCVIAVYFDVLRHHVLLALLKKLKP